MSSSATIRRRPALGAGHRARYPLGRLELLEPRNLLSAGGLPTTTIAPLIVPLAGVTPGYSAIYRPGTIAAAYGFNRIPAFNGTPADGRGQTIAIVNAFHHPNIAADLATFNRTFNIQGTGTLKVANLGTTQVDAGWAMETALDVEWAHAMAPGATILLVEARSANLGDMLAAVAYAKQQPGVSVVSMSWGTGEFAGQSSYDTYFTSPAGRNVVFVAASGDNGAPGTWPAASANVVGVGGSTLQVAGNGSYYAESAWAYGGGSPSRYVQEPAYQASVLTTSGGRRGIPDVAYNADPNTGFYVYDSVPYGGSAGWWAVGGTSAGAPQWAALLAIANQGRALSQRPLLSSALADLYALASSPASYAANFHDVTAGGIVSASGSRAYSAKPGYDLATGLGAPQANALVPALAGMTEGQVKTATATVAARSRRYYPFFLGRYAAMAEALLVFDPSPPAATGANSPPAALASGAMEPTAGRPAMERAEAAAPVLPGIPIEDGGWLDLPRLAAGGVPRRTAAEAPTSPPFAHDGSLVSGASVSPGGASVSPVSDRPRWLHQHAVDAVLAGGPLPQDLLAALPSLAEDVVAGPAAHLVWAGLALAAYRNPVANKWERPDYGRLFATFQ